MYKVAIIGSRNAVLGFMALGFAVSEAENAAEAAKKLHALARSGEYAVIFVTEQYAEQIQEDIDRYKDDPLPAVISIPGQGDSTGYGMNAIRRAAQRAVGADILFMDDSE
ncbi:MAG: V-type ATP synthase subunit F [Clostridia bacterium]|nr:V-type ATP synthase subunit F [Clostridia bacterium]